MADEVPRHWSLSDVEGNMEILNNYQVGLKDIAVGERIVVLFHLPEFLQGSEKWRGQGQRMARLWKHLK